MNFLELAKERFSVRKYSDKPVEQDKINLILKAAQLAPTAVNYQPQMIYVLKSEAALKKIRALTHSTYDAPVVFLICVDENQTWKSPMEKGYTTGEMDARDVHKAFNLPENIKPICLLPIGYAAKDCVPFEPWHNVYKDISEFTTEL